MIKTSKQSFILCVALITLPTFPAVSEAGDCFTDCVNGVNCSSLSSEYNGAFCQDSISRCQMTCLQKTDETYGAIAYSVKNGAFGFSDSFKDRWQAQDAAMRYCSGHGKGCKKMVWFYNSCGAVASDGKKADWGQGSPVQAAERQALDKCSKGFLFFKNHCEVKTSHCSG